MLLMGNMMLVSVPTSMESGMTSMVPVLSLASCFKTTAIFTVSLAFLNSGLSYCSVMVML